MSNEDGKSMGLALILPLLLYIVYLIREIRVSHTTYPQNGTGKSTGGPRMPDKGFCHDNATIFRVIWKENLV